MNEPITIGEKVIHKFMLHGAAESKIVIPFRNTELFYLEIIPIDSKYNVIRLMSKGMNNPARYEYTPRPKKIVNKEPKPKSLFKKTDQLPTETQDTLTI